MNHSSVSRLQKFIIFLAQKLSLFSWFHLKYRVNFKFIKNRFAFVIAIVANAIFLSGISAGTTFQATSTRRVLILDFLALIVLSAKNKDGHWTPEIRFSLWGKMTHRKETQQLFEGQVKGTSLAIITCLEATFNNKSYGTILHTDQDTMNSPFIMYPT